MRGQVGGDRGLVDVEVPGDVAVIVTELRPRCVDAHLAVVIEAFEAPNDRLPDADVQLPRPVGGGVGRRSSRHAEPCSQLVRSAVTSPGMGRTLG
jgi:hypothetical protein